MGVQDEPKLLETMLEDLEAQRDLHRPGPYWQGYARRMAHAIDREGLARFRASPGVGRGFADVFAGDALSRRAPGWRRTALAAVVSLPGIRQAYRRREMLADQRQKAAHVAKQARYAEALEAWFSTFASQHALPDTTVGDPERRLQLAGREIGELYLRTFAWVHDLSTQVDLTRVRTVFEIGGGFGAMAHTLMALFPNIRKYLYLDIPPVLYVGTQYLKHFHADAVRDYASTRTLERLAFDDDDRREILAVAPWQLHRVASRCDLAWNSSSFQEMPEAVVKHYAGHIDRLLADDGRLAFYVYEGGYVEQTLPADRIVAAFQAAGGRLARQVPAAVSATVLPGRMFVAP